MDIVIPTRRIVWIAFLFVAALSDCLALSDQRTIAQYVHTAWGQKEGAPTGTLALAQTSDGFLWLGTVDGLYRFDGVTFELRSPGTVYALLALSNGDLWIGGRSSVSLLRNGQKKDFTVSDGVPAGKVASFAVDADGVLWVATNVGLARLEDNRWKQVGPDDWNFHEAYATGMVLDHKGTLWVAAGHTILNLPRGSHRFQTTGVTYGQVWSLVEAPNKKLWMSEINRAVRPIPLGSQQAPSDKTELGVPSLAYLFDREAGIWIGTLANGLSRVLYPEQMEARVFGNHDPQIETFSVTNGLTGNLVTSILQDREGNIWVGTNAGLDRFYKGKVAPVPLSSAPFPTVMAPGDDGTVWVRSADMLQIDGSGKILEQRGSEQYLNAHRGKDGALWWSKSGFVDRVGPGKIDWTRIHVIPAPIDPVSKARQALTITEDGSGAIWAVSESAGVFALNDSHWEHIDGVPTPRGYRGSAIFADSAGRIWTGFYDGTLVEIEDGKVKMSWTAANSPVGHVLTSIAGRGNNIWLGGSKLVYFDGATFSTVIPAEGSQFNLWGIDEAQDGSLWLCENRGVVHISAAEVNRFLLDHRYKVHFEIDDSLEGLPGSFRDASSPTTVIQATDGRFWFATTGGIAWVDPAGTSKNTLPPPVAIRSIRADNKEYPIAGARIPPLATALEISYSALSLSIPERVQFRYKLEGVDRTWEIAGTRRTAFYTGLKPGNYRFQVIACNNDGVWNETGASLEFSVAPAWFQTSWFRAACLGMTLLLLWAIYRLRVQHLQRQFNEHLETRVHERTRIARELHDTLLQSLHGLMFEFQAARNMFPKHPEEALQALDSALTGTEQAITESQDAIEDLRGVGAQERDLAQLIEVVGEEQASPQSLGHEAPTFGLTVEGQSRTLTPQARDEAYRITREVLRNAFRHARARRIEAEILYGENELRLRVRDDGKGMEPEVLAEGGRPGHWGLPGIRERAAQIGAKLDVWSETGVGTEIQLTIPASVAYQKASTPTGFRLFRRVGRHEQRS